MGLLGSRSRLASLVTLTAALASLHVAPAGAELVERGGLFVEFRGGLAPTALPRHELAPIGVSIDGTVKTLSGERPPALRRIEIRLNKGGVIDTEGLPRCRQRQIESSSDEQALAACGSALVGTGAYEANTAFPEQAAFPSNGKIHAFNAVVGGHRAILAHVYGIDPAPITRIIVFHIRDGEGPFGTVLSGRLPANVNRYGYVKRISLSLFRRYRYRGKERSYISAACPAPPGFPGANFPFARASMDFADGRSLSSTLTRSCSVR